MPINTKINLPMSTANPLPNPNNLTDEAVYLSVLINKKDRINTGQQTWRSLTSGITYKTIDYQLDEDIYNCGETGLYNLLVKLYGTANNGWLFMAEDFNAIATNVNKNTADIAKNTNDIVSLKSASNIFAADGRTVQAILEKAVYFA